MVTLVYLDFFASLETVFCYNPHTSLGLLSVWLCVRVCLSGFGMCLCVRPYVSMGVWVCVTFLWISWRCGSTRFFYKKVS